MGFKQHKWWIVAATAVIAGLFIFWWLKPNKSLQLADYIPENAAFVLKFKADKLTDAEMDTLSRFGFPPNMLRQLFGNPQQPGTIISQKMMLFGELTPGGPALGLLFEPKDLSEFQKIVAETRYTGSTLNKKGEINFIEINTGLYLSWNENIALLSYQLTAGDSYPAGLLETQKKVSALPSCITSDSFSCMMKPISILQMLNYEKPSSVLTAIAGILPEKTTLCGVLKSDKGRISINTNVTEGATELQALLKPEAGREICADGVTDQSNGTIIYLALQKPMIGNIAALAGQTGNPLLDKLNGNACLWLKDKTNGTDTQPWLLWLGATFSEAEKILLKQMPAEANYAAMQGLTVESAGNCLLLKPAGQGEQQPGYRKPRFPLEFHRQNAENSLHLAGNSRSMQLTFEAGTSGKSNLLLLLKALGNTIPKENHQP